MLVIPTQLIFQLKGNFTARQCVCVSTDPAVCSASDENVQELAVELVQLGFISEVRVYLCEREKQVCVCVSGFVRV